VKICDRCGEKSLALVLSDKKNGQEWDLCKRCEEAFYIFMQPYEKIDVTPKKEKRGPGRPKKNGKD